MYIRFVEGILCHFGTLKFLKWVGVTPHLSLGAETILSTKVTTARERQVMRRLNVKRILCASVLAIGSSAAIAQDQIQPQFTPAAPAATAGRLSADATTSTLIKVDGSRVVDVS